MSISFRVQLKISEGNQFSFNSPAPETAARFQNSSGGMISIEAKESTKANGSDLLVIASSGYIDWDSASTEATKTLGRIRLAALKLGMGIEFQPGIHISFAEGERRDTFTRHNRQIIQDFGNVTVFDDHPPPQFIEMSGTMTQTRNISVLLDAIEAIPGSVSESLNLAAELHNQSLFEASHRAKFLSLITAVEVISKQSMRSPEELQLVDGFSAQIAASELGEIEKQKLASAIGSLRRQSISDAAYAIITEKLSKNDANRFRHFYALRGKLTHRSALIAIEREATELKILVERLITSLLEIGG